MPLLQKVVVNVADGCGGEEPIAMPVATSSSSGRSSSAEALKRIHDQIASPQMVVDGSALFVYPQGIATDLSRKQFQFNKDKHYVKRVKCEEPGKACTYAEIKKMVSTLILFTWLQFHELNAFRTSLCWSMKLRVQLPRRPVAELLVGFQDQAAQDQVAEVQDRNQESIFQQVVILNLAWKPWTI